MNTLYLTVPAAPGAPGWDLTVDTSNNIAMASDPYSVAQDVASAVKLFAGELYYDTSQGVPYFSQVLGKQPPLALMKSLLETAALTVPEVASATAIITGLLNRQLTGQIQITTTSGATPNVGF